MAGVFKTTLSSKKALSGNVSSFTFDLSEPKEIVFKPGQYVILRVQGKPRLYSIASSAGQKSLFELIVELVPGGLASEFLKALAPGEEVVFFGPAGQFTLRETQREKVFLVTGTGIAPARSIINSEALRTGIRPKLHLFWGMKLFSDIYGLDEWRAWKDPKFNLGLTRICLSREKSFEAVAEGDRAMFGMGHVDRCLEMDLASAGKKLDDYEYYLCGGSHVVESLRNFLYGKGVPKEQVFYEKF